MFVYIKTIYNNTAPAISKKSPRENENSTINVKQHTMAGPRSPRMRNKNTVLRMAMRAVLKKIKDISP